MQDKKNESADEQALTCPDCKGLLKRRRSRKPDECEMLCGVCGQQFDVCDLETVDRLKNQS
jgi:hypothetical protein